MAKKPGASGIILLAVILGLVTAYFIWAYLRDVKKQSEANWQPVVVAVTDIKPRTTVSRDMIALTRFPQDHIAADAVTEIKQAEGRIALGRIRAKEQVRASDLVQKGQAPSLAYEIPPGKRAVAIAAGEVMAAGSTVKPGDHVDILATYHDPISRQDTTQMILQNVNVLWVNTGQTDTAGPDGAKSSMTVAVTPEEVELLTAADRAGALRVALRPVQDQTVVSSPGVTVRDLGSGKVIETGQLQTEARATQVIISPPPSRTRPTISIIRGTQEQTASP
jgi:pilus assembly protein CpaB